MKNYLALLDRIMEFGDTRQGRNAVTRALFAEQLRWDLSLGFPIVTTKEINFRAIAGELLWFLSGSTNDDDLKRIMGYPPEKNTIWSANANDPRWRERAERYGYAPGQLGRIYGQQWRMWRGCKSGEVPGFAAVFLDQIADVINRIKKDPYDRRLIVTAWNPVDLDEMALPACHVMFQFFCDSKNGLSLSMIQRSCDTFLGVPYNISSYALLLSMVAQVTGRTARDLVITFQDVHIYAQHYGAVLRQLERVPRLLPALQLNPACKQISDFSIGDISLVGYEPDEPIKAPMIV